MTWALREGEVCVVYEARVILVKLMARVAMIWFGDVNGERERMEGMVVTVVRWVVL